MLDTLKQSPVSEIQPENPAKDTWVRGKAMLKGGKREFQKSGGSSGSGSIPVASVPSMVPRYRISRI